MTIRTPQTKRSYIFYAKFAKKLFSIHGCPVIVNCDTSTEKSSEFLFLDHHLKPVMQSI